MSLGVDFAAELTYPEPESSSSGLMIAVGQAFSIPLTLAYQALTDSFSLQTAVISCSVLLFFGTGVTALISSELRRQKAITDAEKKLSLAHDSEVTRF